MNKWLIRGLLAVGVLSISAVITVKSVQAAATSGSATSANAKGETATGDFVADAVRTAAKADVALVPASVLEDKDLPPDSSPDAARQVLSSPSEPISTVKVPGKQLLGALERSVSLAPRRNQGFLQVSGVTFNFDPGRPEGGRILEAAVAGSSLKPDKIYTVAMPDSLVRGSLGYFKFWDAKDAKGVIDSKGAKVVLLDALLARLKTNKPSASIDNRIKSK